MRPSTLVYSLLVGARSVYADGAAIAAAVDSITSSVVEFHNTVTAWDGQLTTTPPLTVSSANVLDNVVKGKQVAQESGKMSIREALKVKGSFVQLIGNLTSTSDLLIETKPKFVGAFLRGSVILALRRTKAATDQFAGAIMSKVPKAGHGAGKKIIKKVDAEFHRALEEYRIAAE